MAGKDVLIVGPGFIGWPLMTLLLGDGYRVTGFCRRKEHGDALLATGASRIIYGDLSDHDLIAKETADHDIVFHTATADDLPSVQAVLDGVRQRASQDKGIIYIHTSGTSVLDDQSSGEYRGEKIYTDKDPDSINAVPDDAPHRPIDLAIVQAQKELGQKAKIAIMIPPEIYGYNSWNKRLTIQIPTITRFALKHGFAGYVGKGLAVESQIHVNDLVKGYVTLLHYVEANGVEATLHNPYFFCENGKEFSWLEVATEVGKGLHAAGRIRDAKARPFDLKDYDELFGKDTPAVIGLNSRSRALRLRELGWEPSEKGIWESYHQDELPVLLAEAEQDRPKYANPFTSGRDKKE